MTVQEKIQQLKDYRDNPAISQSALIALHKSPRSFTYTMQRTTSFFTLGSIVDTLATLGKEAYDEQYVVATTEKLTGQLGAFVEALVEYDLNKVFTIKSREEYAYDMSGSKSPINKMIERYAKEGGEEYYKALMASVGKERVEPSQEAQANMIVNTLKTDKFTSVYFNNSNYEYQVPLYATIDGVMCKGLVDILEINEENKTVRVVDLKTTGKSVNNFIQSMLTYRYDIQGAYYTELLELQERFKDYTILPPRFIVIETDLWNPPLIFELSKLAMHLAKWGGEKLVGYRQILSAYKMHVTTEQWDYPVEYNTEGVIYVGDLEV